MFSLVSNRYERASMIVTYNGRTSQPASVEVKRTSFGVYHQTVNGEPAAIAQNVVTFADYRLNQASALARPGDTVVLWGRDRGPSMTRITTLRVRAAIRLKWCR